jgi:L-aspartate oxidase
MSVAHFNVIVVGSGVAGLSFLHYLKNEQAQGSKHQTAALFCKSNISDTNTSWAQGGIAAVQNIASSNDSIQKHIEDTLMAGAFTNDKTIVKKVIEQGPALMQDLLEMGMLFDTTKNNDIDLAKEGGHSAHRVWHVKDYTGKALQQTLLENLNNNKANSIFENCLVISIDKIEASLFLVTVYDLVSKIFTTYTSNAIVLATGGIGQLYQKTTNALVATADGIYLASRLGAQIEGLSFIQFHPTGLFTNKSSTFLISEALRGAGAVLRNRAGQDFMYKYHASGSLAPRDIVSRAIINEMQLEQKLYQYLDATAIDKEVIENHFPSIYATVKAQTGIDITTTPIPIVPTQHYSCGGIQVNEFGETTVSNMYAIGECAHTGLHGANRLASNSLLEGLAFGKFAAGAIVKNASVSTNEDTVLKSPPKTSLAPTILAIDKAVIKEVVSTYASVLKTTEGLKKGFDLIASLIDNAKPVQAFSKDAFEAQCMAQAALLLFKDALSQTINKGVFYNESIA